MKIDIHGVAFVEHDDGWGVVLGPIAYWRLKGGHVAQFLWFQWLWPSKRE